MHADTSPDSRQVLPPPRQGIAPCAENRFGKHNDPCALQRESHPLARQTALTRRNQPVRLSYWRTDGTERKIPSD